MMKMSRPDLVAPFLIKESKRDKARPYVLAMSIAVLIILLSIEGVY